MAASEIAACIDRHPGPHRNQYLRLDFFGPLKPTILPWSSLGFPMRPVRTISHPLLKCLGQ